jgi:hypothetical protein
MEKKLQAKRMKSSFSVIVKEYISGVQTIALEFPPNYASLASISPKVLVTDSLPGKARCGPSIN